MTACGDGEQSYPTSGGNYDEFLLRVAEALEGGATTLEQVFYHAQATDTQQEHPQISDDGGIGKDQSILLPRG
jgi:hypothetical protein